MDRYKDAKIASILGMFGNVILFIFKIIVGIITNSQAMLSDALNSAGDIITSIMTFVGSHIASQEADDDHNLGHGKAEYIFSLLISVIMIYLCLRMIYSSFKSLFVSYEYHFSISLIVVCFITIIIKMSLFLYTNKVAKKHDNILVKANANDHRNDCFLTCLTMVASICGYFKITYVDGIMGILVSLWILYVGIKLFKESYDILMDKGIDNELKQKILDIVETHDEIIKINHLNSTPNGYQYQISITIFVDGNLSTFESHEIANKLEKEITQLDEIYLTIVHVNPYKM